MRGAVPFHDRREFIDWWEAEAIGLWEPEMETQDEFMERVRPWFDLNRHLLQDIKVRP